MPSPNLIGSYAPDFEIPGIDNSVHHLARYLESFSLVGVVFMCNHCPYVGMYLERLKQLQTQFAGKGFTLIGINSNDANQFPADSFESMKSFAHDRQINFPYLRDNTQDVAHSFRAEKTPHVFLVNQKSVICYSGGIDDNPENPASVKSRYLEDAIVQVLQGEPVTTPSSPVVGCSIKWRSS